MLKNRFENATPDQITEALADAMRRHGDGCTRNQLKSDGFSNEQIDRYGDRAREHATALASSTIRARVPAAKAA